MSNRYSVPRIDISKVKTYSIKDRKSKVTVSAFSDIGKWKKTKKLEDLFPGILKADDLKDIADRIVAAHKKSKPVIVAMGAHVIKCGCSPLINDLVSRGVITGIALNGAGSVHDYEVAFNGATSEDVAEEIQVGSFGMAEETGAMINGALKNLESEETGMGEALGRDMEKRELPHKNLSIIYNGYEKKVPVTVHVAIGTDITHLHPSMNGAELGKATYNDFKLFTSMVAELGNGGCFLNIGSSVLLPEVFLKALTVTRNLGYDVGDFTTVNMDMIQHYRPNVNVVSRPTLNSGKGYSITGHHEIMIPLLYSMIMERLA